MRDRQDDGRDAPHLLARVRRQRDDALRGTEGAVVADPCGAGRASSIGAEQDVALETASSSISAPCMPACAHGTSAGAAMRQRRPRDARRRHCRLRADSRAWLRSLRPAPPRARAAPSTRTWFCASAPSSITRRSPLASALRDALVLRGRLHAGDGLRQIRRHAATGTVGSGQQHAGQVLGHAEPVARRAASTGNEVVAARVDECDRRAVAHGRLAQAVCEQRHFHAEVAADDAASRSPARARRSCNRAAATTGSPAWSRKSTRRRR